MSHLGKAISFNIGVTANRPARHPVYIQPTLAPTPQPQIYPTVPSAPVFDSHSNSEPFEWVSTSVHYCDHLLGRAVQAGHEAHDGSPIYIGRAHHDGELVPCKVIPRHRAAYIPYNGQEISVLNIELYCRRTPTVNWVPASFGNIPPGAVPGGHAKNGETLFLGRAHYNGSITPGKVHGSHRCLYIPFGGREVPIQNYEVMVVNYI